MLKDDDTARKDYKPASEKFKKKEVMEHVSQYFRKLMISANITFNNPNPLSVLSRVAMICIHVVALGLKLVGKKNRVYGGANFLRENMFGTLPWDSHNRTHVPLNTVICNLHHSRVLRNAMHIIETHVSRPPRSLGRIKNRALELGMYWEQAKFVGDIRNDIVG